MTILSRFRLPQTFPINTKFLISQHTSWMLTVCIVYAWEQLVLLVGVVSFYYVGFVPVNAFLSRFFHQFVTANIKVSTSLSLPVPWRRGRSNSEQEFLSPLVDWFKFLQSTCNWILSSRLVVSQQNAPSQFIFALSTYVFMIYTGLYL